jgi:hypothetical protein
MDICVYLWKYITKEKNYESGKRICDSRGLGIAISSDDKTEGKECSYIKYHNNSKFF